MKDQDFELEITEQTQNIEESYIKNYVTVPDGCGSIKFETDEQAQSCLFSVHNWIENMAFSPDNTFNNNSMNIFGIQYVPNSKQIFFGAFSECEEHMLWQLNQFLDFCKTLTGVREFNTDILKTITPVAWKKE